MSTPSNDKKIELEILEWSYWEHFKMAKDIALILPIDHPKRKAIEEEVNRIQKKLHELKQNKP